MLKLLISSILVSNPVYSTVEVVNHETTAKNTTSQIVDLTKEKIDPISVDISYLDGQYLSGKELQEAIIESIVFEIVSENDELDWINNFMYSVLWDQPEDWKVTGFKYEIPKGENVIKSKGRFAASKNISEFRGLLTVDVSLTNGETGLKKNLSDDLKETNLGEIFVDKNDNSEQNVLNRISELNHNLVMSEVQLESFTDKNAKLVVKKGSTIYEQSSKEVTFNLITNKLLKLEEHLVNTDLGKITIYSNEDAQKAVINKIAELNPNLIMNELIFEKFTNSSIKLSVNKNSTVYEQASRNIIFELDIIRLIKLEEHLLKTELGTVKVYNDEDAKEVVINKILELNPQLIFNELIFEQFTKDNIKVSVKLDSRVYEQSSIYVSFNLLKIKLIKLSTDLKITDLGKIKSKDKSTILDSLKKLNPKLNLNEIYIADIADDSARVNVNKDSNVYFQDSLIINYNLPDPAFNLTKLNGNLGYVGSDLDSTLFTKLESINNIYLDKTKLKIEDKKYNYAVITSKDSEVYTGRLIIKFNYDISITNINLSTSEAAVEAYSSTQTSTKQVTFTYTIQNSQYVDNFFDAYKYVTIKTNGYTDIKTLNKDREIHNFSSTRKFRLVNTQDSEIAYKNYSGAQNWNKSRTSLSISISGNRISFTMYAKADAYATAWNAYWSRAWAKISLESVIFSNQ